jgi:hypothetical protein
MCVLDISYDKNFLNILFFFFFDKKTYLISELFRVSLKKSDVSLLTMSLQTFNLDNVPSKLPKIINVSSNDGTTLNKKLKLEIKKKKKKIKK